jgi:di/tricarboxylate transporter
MSKTVLNWITGKNPLALTAIVLPFVVLTLNCVAWVVAALSRSDDMMPYAYRMTLIRD